MNNSQKEFNGHLQLPDLPELVIDIIFKNLEWESLLTCRLVWKGWEKRVKSLIEKNDTLFLNFTDHVFPRNDEIIENIFHNPNVLIPSGIILSAVDVNTISQLEKVSDFLKFRNLHWNFWPLYGNHGKFITSDNFFSVLRILGTTLETFDCFEISIVEMTTEQYNKVLGTLSLPNLRKLYLPRHKIIQDGNSAHCWQRLVISASPNLNFVKERSRFQEVNLDVVKMLNETGGLSKIKGLTLVNLTEEQLEILLQSGIQLEEFKARFREQKNSFAEKLQEFLHKQKGTLRKLYLNSEAAARPLNMPTMPIMLPIMKNLKHLSFSPGNLFKSLKFAQQLPKLKELELLQSEFPGNFIGLLLQDFAFNSDNPCKTLRTLKLDMARHPTAYGTCCDLFGKIFPCVSTLHLRWPTEKFLEGVWRHCPNLKELYLESVSQGDASRCILQFQLEPCLLDDVLFGIPEEWVNSVDTSQEDWWTRVTPPESEIPTMLNLKCLEKLAIRDSGSKMTKFSVYFGLAKMKNLRLLEITESDKFTISEEDLNFLRETIPGLIITETDLPTLI